MLYPVIAYFDTASGVARQNQCVTNELHGIYVDEQAQPQLEENSCCENKWYGIYIAKTANPRLSNNRCSNNGEGNVYDEQKGFLGRLFG